MFMDVTELFLDFVMIYVSMKVISNIISIRIFIEVDSKKEQNHVKS